MKIESIPTTVFRGGLGDIILKTYRTTAYTDLQHIESRNNIVIASSNPFAGELVRWHPKWEYMKVFDLSAYFMKYRGESGDPNFAVKKALSVNGLPPEKKFKKRNQPVEFFAIDEIDSIGHVVFHPFAGKNDRSLPKTVQKKFFDLFKKFDVQVFVVTRDYLRRDWDGRRICHNEEKITCKVPSNVTVLTNTSIPAVLKLVQQSSVFVGTDSALVHCAWNEEKPTIYMKGKYFANRTGVGYLWGTKREDCQYQSFRSLDWIAAETFLEERLGKKQ